MYSQTCIYKADLIVDTVSKTDNILEPAFLKNLHQSPLCKIDTYKAYYKSTTQNEK